MLASPAGFLVGVWAASQQVLFPGDEMVAVAVAVVDAVPVVDVVVHAVVAVVCCGGVGVDSHGFGGAGIGVGVGVVDADCLGLPQVPPIQRAASSATTSPASGDGLRLFMFAVCTSDCRRNAAQVTA